MTSLPDRVLVVIPVYGHHDMTHELLGDLRREADVADVVIVDNGGDYPAAHDEMVLRPGSNLGWAAGTNHGTTEARRPEHTAFLWLNNDTRLAGRFIAGLLTAWHDTGAGVVGPFYDCHWFHQRAPKMVPVDAYLPQRRHYRAPFVDGTAMLVPATTVDSIGLLDAETFSPVGWGAEIDYGLRARDAGLEVVLTRMAYLHHELQVTAKTVFEGGSSEYAEVGFPAALDGLKQNWGDDWQRLAGIPAGQFQTTPTTWRRRLRRRARQRRH